MPRKYDSEENRRRCSEYYRRVKKDPAKLQLRRTYSREYYRRHIKNDPAKMKRRRTLEKENRSHIGEEAYKQLRKGYQAKHDSRVKADPVRLERRREKAKEKMSKYQESLKADPAKAAQRKQYERDYRLENHMEIAHKKSKHWHTVVKVDPVKLARLRARAVDNLHGLAPGQYDQMLIDQDGKCAICGGTAGGNKNNRLHVDHCHKTGKIRALLCNGCNAGLGMFKDDPNLLKAAIKYLNASSSSRSAASSKAQSRRLAC